MAILGPPMKIALPILSLLALSGSQAIAAPFQDEAPATIAWPALPDIGPTDRMDPEVVQVVQQHVDAVVAAQSAGTDAEAQTAAAKAYAELGLVYEGNTMWKPAISCYRGAYELSVEEGPQKGSMVVPCRFLPTRNRRCESSHGYVG